MDKKTIKILIADNIPAIRSGLKALLSDEEDMIIQGEAEDEKKLFEFLNKDKFDIIILDLMLPDENGNSVLGELVNRYPEIPVLILGDLPDDQYTETITKGGAKGYVSKFNVPEQLISAIKTVVSGNTYPGIPVK